jgi:VanZ family protein
MNQRIGSRVIGGVTLGWLACFAYLTLSPRIPDLPGLATDDEVLGAGHLVASLILTALVYLWLVSAFPHLSRMRTAAIAFGAATAFGLIVELIQFPVPEREPQLADAGLDLTGSAIAVAALALVSQPTLRRPQMPAIGGTLGAILVATTAAWIVWGSADTPAEQRCPGSVADEPLPAARPADLPFGETGRIDAGLVGLFDFAEGPTGESSAPVDLVAEGSVEPLDPSGIRILEDDAVMSSRGPARQIVDRIVDRFTLEAWVRPDRLTQHGPARIVSNSDGVALSDANFQLGQDRHCLSLRVDAGGPEAEWLLFEDVFDRPQSAWHLVTTYDRGIVRIFVDGERRFEASLRDADLSGWSRDYPLLVGNEVTRDRPFRGDVYLVAVYDRALTASEVAQNYDAGI